MLTGTYQHTLDGKGRMNVPSRMRDELGDAFYVTRWLDDCLVIFGKPEWDAICEKIRALPMGRSRDIQRFLFANAVEVEVDAQGRIILPQTLREMSGIGRDVTVIGVMDRAEIWDRAKWLEKSSGMSMKTLEADMLDLNI